MSLGTLADNILRQALLIGISFGIISVPGFGNSDDAIPIIGILLPLGILTFSPIAGQLADKLETSLMLRRTKAVEIILMVFAAVAFMSGNGPAAIATLFAMGVQSAFFSPTRTAALPKYLTPDELLRGNALCNAGLFTFILLGYGVGGYLIALPNGPNIVGFALVSASFFGWLASLRAPFAEANDPSLKISFNSPRLALRIVKISARCPGIFPPLLGAAVFYFFSTAMTVLVPLFARDTLLSGPMVATALNGFFALGAGLGSIFAATLPKGRSGLGFSGAAVLLASVTCVGLGIVFILIPVPQPGTFSLRNLLTTPFGLCICTAFILMSAFMAMYISPLQAAMQRRAPHDVRARIMATCVFANAVFAIPGSLSVLSVTSAGLTPPMAFIALGLLMAGIAGVMAYRKQKFPDGHYDESLRDKSAHKVNEKYGAAD